MFPLSLKGTQKRVQSVRGPQKTSRCLPSPFSEGRRVFHPFLLKLPGPLHPVSESLPSHQSRKDPLPSDMFKYLAFLLSPGLRYRVRERHVDCVPLISLFVFLKTIITS